MSDLWRTVRQPTSYSIADEQTRVTGVILDQDFEDADRVAAMRADLIAMIFADDASDNQRGSGGLDWFLADLSGAFRDTVLGEVFAEHVTDTGR